MLIFSCVFTVDQCWGDPEEAKATWFQNLLAQGWQGLVVRQTACPRDAVNKSQRYGARTQSVRVQYVCIWPVNFFYASGWVCTCGLLGNGSPASLRLMWRMNKSEGWVYFSFCISLLDSAVLPPGWPTACFCACLQNIKSLHLCVIFQLDDTV